MSAAPTGTDGFVPGRHLIDAYGTGAFRFAGMSHIGSILATPAGVRAAHLVLAAVTVASSWTLVPTLFTMHYADMFDSVVPGGDRPLNFPKSAQPLFWDFAYFSFTIAAACQTADVATNCIGVRKVVIAHTVISFVFNAAVLGFAINVTAGLIGGG